MDVLSVEETDTVDAEEAGDTTHEERRAAYEVALAAFQHAETARANARRLYNTLVNTRSYLKSRRDLLEEQAAHRRKLPKKDHGELLRVRDLFRSMEALDIERDRTVENDYCVARHRMMVALFALEAGDAAALVRKVRHMSRAVLPEEMDSDDVLYYRDGRKTHLFYGGGLSPTGDGASPDGVGHGHVVLIEDNVGYFRVDYHRKPRER